MQVMFLILLFILGSCFGSFLCCQARRLHLKSTKKKHNLNSRSICLHCGYQLKWYDNIPIISWLFLRGKCRKCHQPIGVAEILSEIGLALSFLALGTSIDIFTATPLAWATFIATIVLTTTLFFLAIYDGIYGELPTRYLILAIIIATIILALKEWTILSSSALSPELFYKPVFSVAVLGGLYLALYLVSKGRWVGDGDWLLGLSLGLALYDPWLALITLFLANLIACIVMYPSARRSHQSKIHFGPFLVIAFVIVLTFSDFFCSFIVS